MANGVLRSQLESLFERVRSNSLLPTDLIDESEIRMDGNAAWVSDMIDRRSLHDPDYALFARFPESKGTILDVGANWGYSVGSIRASGCQAPILSFEILAPYRGCLEAVKQKLGSGYDYVLCGVSSTCTDLEIFIPTLSGLALTSLTSAVKVSFNAGMVRNVMDYAAAYLQDEAELIPGILRLKAQAAPIDVLLRGEVIQVPTSPIAAVKIDVEGLEAEVLRGAQETLGRDAPLLIIEGANRDESVRAELDRHSYVLATWQGDRLMLSEGIAHEGANGIFLHPRWFHTYRAWNLLI